MCKKFWDFTTMNIDPKNNKSDQIFSPKGLVRAHQNDLYHSLGKKWIFHEVSIIWFSTYQSFSAWLLLYLTVSKMFNLTKFEAAKAWSDPPQRASLWVCGNPFSKYPNISESLILWIIIPEILNLTKLLGTKIQWISSQMVKVRLERDTSCC